MLRKWYPGMFIAFTTALSACATQAKSTACFDVPLAFPVAGDYPADHNKYAVYDHEQRELYRGKTDDKGVAHICVDRLPKNATILLDPGTNSAKPSPIFGEKP